MNGAQMLRGNENIGLLFLLLAWHVIQERNE